MENLIKEFVSSFEKMGFVVTNYKSSKVGAKVKNYEKSVSKALKERGYNFRIEKKVGFTTIVSND